jgi:hypothetical protein
MTRAALRRATGVRAVGLRVLLAATHRLGVRRFRDVGFEPGRLDLLDHVPPTGAALDGDRDLAVAGAGTDLVLEPSAKSVTIRLPKPAPPDLARLDLEGVEGDLAAMQIEPTYHRH